MNQNLSNTKLSFREVVELVILVITIAGNIMYTTFTVENLEDRVHKVEAVNPELLSYRIGKLEQSVTDMSKKIDRIYEISISNESGADNFNDSRKLSGRTGE